MECGSDPPGVGGKHAARSRESRPRTPRRPFLLPAPRIPQCSRGPRGTHGTQRASLSYRHAVGGPRPVGALAPGVRRWEEESASRVEEPSGSPAPFSSKGRRWRLFFGKYSSEQNAASSASRPASTRLVPRARRTATRR